MQRLKVMERIMTKCPYFLGAGTAVYVVDIKPLAPELVGAADYFDISQLLSKRVHSVLS